MSTIHAEFAQQSSELRSLAWKLYKITGRSLFTPGTPTAIIDTLQAFAKKLEEVRAMAVKFESELKAADLAQDEKHPQT